MHNRSKNCISAAKASLLRTLAASVLCFGLCLVCLAGSVWGWFTSSKTVPVTAISSGAFGLDETATTSYDATAGEAREISVIAVGPAEKGYVLFDTPEGNFACEAHKGENTFTLLLAKPGTVTLSSGWAVPEGYQLVTGGQIGSGTAAAAEPEPSPDAEVTADPETTPGAEVSAEPETVPSPEITTEPEAAPSPEITTEPEAVPSAEVTAEPEHSPSEEITPESDAAATPTPES